MGRECRYDGCHNRDGVLEAELAAAGEEALPFCPEERGGLPTPRPPAWIEARDAGAVLDGHDRVVTEGGGNVTAPFVRGAELALAKCAEFGIEKAYLKERSPSCGVATTHVNGVPVPGPGVTAALLARAGIEVVGVEGKRAAPEG